PIPSATIRRTRKVRRAGRAWLRGGAVMSRPRGAPCAGSSLLTGAGWRGREVARGTGGGASSAWRSLAGTAQLGRRRGVGSPGGKGRVASGSVGGEISDGSSRRRSFPPRRGRGGSPESEL